MAIILMMFLFFISSYRDGSDTKVFSKMLAYIAAVFRFPFPFPLLFLLPLTMPVWAQSEADTALIAPPPHAADIHTAEPELEPAPQSAVVSDPVTPTASVKPERTRASFDLKLRAIEERVNDLKEKIFRSKARLMQLQEVVLNGSISGARARLVHRNEMGSSFRLIRVQYALDGAPIFSRIDTGKGELEEADEVEIFSGSVAPGNHQLSVFLEYRGNGYGIFSYLNEYKFKIKSSFTFKAEEGRFTTIDVVGYEKGNITTELQDRPAVRYDLEVSQNLLGDETKEGSGVAGASDATTGSH